MAKRFTDTEKYKKSFIRGLPGAYKLLWDYLYHDCNHAGIWEVDFEVAQIRIGTDMPVNILDALKFFNNSEDRIVVLDGGSKWFIKPFIDFQYGVLNPDNRVHSSVLSSLSKEGLSKPLTSSLQGAKDKDKDKDKEKDKEEREPFGFVDFWNTYPKKRSRGQALKAWKNLNPSIEQVRRITAAINRAKTSPDWEKEDGRYIPYPATWLNAHGWEDVLENHANGVVG